jgi:hypothetical protein
MENQNIINEEKGNDVNHVLCPVFSKSDVIAVLTKRRDDAFDNEWHKHAHNEINTAIRIIKELMPPSYFPNGA